MKKIVTVFSINGYSPLTVKPAMGVISLTRLILTHSLTTGAERRENRFFSDCFAIFRKWKVK